MNVSLRVSTLVYTVALAFGVSFAVGGAMYGLSSQSLRKAYESRYEAAAREAVLQLLDPVYRLDAFGVKRLRDLLHESDPSMVKSHVVDRKGVAFWDDSERPRPPLQTQIEEVRLGGQWHVDTKTDPWLFVGPIVDATGVSHGVAALEFSTAELSRDLSRMRGAALLTALLATFIGCGVGFFLARRAARPFDRLVVWVQDVGSRELPEPVPPSVLESPLAELRRLAGAVEEMVDRLDKTTVSLEEARAARQEAERADRLKTRFLANLSHEIRTPLHAIVGHSDLLRVEGAGPRYNERIEGIQIAVRSLLRLVEDILDLSKIESGNLELTYEPLSLERLAREVIEITQVRADPGKLDLSVRLDPSLNLWRLGDADRIRQILVNLVSNALKFTVHGEVTLDVSAGEAEDVLFVVQDTGRGIPADEIENLFQPFARLVVDSARVSGSGLGLAICRQLAEAMGGELSLESVEGEGTRAYFKIALPSAIGDVLSEPDQSVEVPGAAKPAGYEGMKVLVVEDNPINQAVLSSMLEVLGCEVRLADNGEQGVAQWGTFRPDLVLMDCSMPVLDGFDAARRIRLVEEQSGNGRVAIVALTAHARKEDQERCRAAGMDSVLVKPLSLERLRETLGDVKRSNSADM